MRRPSPELRDILATATAFAIPLRTRFRGVDVRDGVLLQGPAGWAEFAPFRDYSDQQCVPWLESALEAASVGWPAPVRETIEVNVTVPAVDAVRAAELVRSSGCRTAKVKVADTADFRASLAADVDRVAAVRDALGPDGAVRVDANGQWTVPQATAALRQLDRTAGGLQYAEQPCRTVAELAELRRVVDVPIAADESIRLAGDAERVAVADAADVAVLKVSPLGGVRAAMRVAAAIGLRVVVSSALDTAVGMSAGLALAGALPALDLACGLNTGELLVADVCSAPFQAVNGRLPIPRRSPEPNALQQVRADDEAARFWLARLARVAELLPP